MNDLYRERYNCKERETERGNQEMGEKNGDAKEKEWKWVSERGRKK